MENKIVVEKWITDERDNFDLWIREATRLFWQDNSVRMPRTDAERQNGLELWLEQRRVKLGKELQKSFSQYFPSMARKLSPAHISTLFDDLVWPQVKPVIQRYAIFGFAAAWVGRHMGDATTIGTPELDNQHWCVPIGINGYGSNLGQIVLDLSGEVIPELTTTRAELLKAICEPSISNFSTPAR